MKKLVDLKNAKNETYRKQLADAEEREICPLCEEVIRKRSQVIHVQNEYWIVTENIYPHNAVLHLLLVSVRHIEEIGELAPTEWQSFGGIVQELARKFNILGAALALRFGDTSRTGATIRHIHAHLIVPHEHCDTGASSIVWFSIGT